MDEDWSAAVAGQGHREIPGNRLEVHLLFFAMSETSNMESTRTMAIEIEVMRKIRRGKNISDVGLLIRLTSINMPLLYSPKGTVYHGTHMKVTL